MNNKKKGDIKEPGGTDPDVDEFLKNTAKWRKEFEKLREIIRDCGLNEEFKWCNPCYTFGGSNVVLIHGFKEYCANPVHQGILAERS